MASPVEPTQTGGTPESGYGSGEAPASRQAPCPDREHEIVARVLREVERSIDARVDARTDARIDARLAAYGVSQLNRPRDRTALVLGSIALGLPLVAIGGAIAHLPGLILVLVTILLVNVIDFFRP